MRPSVGKAPCGKAKLSACVLVVDDDPLVRYVAVETLVDAGFETIEAGDAAQALELLRGDDRTVHVLLTDVRMPGRMNGFELSLVAKQKWPELRVIVTGRKAVSLSSSKGSAPRICSGLSDPFR